MYLWSSSRRSPSEEASFNKQSFLLKLAFMVSDAGETVLYLPTVHTYIDRRISRRLLRASFHFLVSVTQTRQEKKTYSGCVGFEPPWMQEFRVLSSWTSLGCSQAVQCLEDVGTLAELRECLASVFRTRQRCDGWPSFTHLTPSESRTHLIA